MENQKNNKGVITLLVIIIVALLILVALTATGTVSFKFTTNENNKQSFEVDTNNSATKKSNLLDLSKIEKYKNYDDSYGIKKYFLCDTSDGFYRFELLLDNKASVCNKDGCHDISNTSDVVDIVQLEVSGDEEHWKYYILQDNGDVYVYELGNFDKGVYTATKVNNVSNVVELVRFDYSPYEYTEGEWGVFAITKDNQYIELDRESV